MAVVGVEIVGRTVAAAIANGASITGDLDLGKSRLFGIQMPSGWTTAALTFQASADGRTWANVYDSDGTELSISSSVAAVDRFIVFTPTLLAHFMSIQHLRVRSGTAGSAVSQGAARSLSLVVVQ